MKKILITVTYNDNPESVIISNDNGVSLTVDSNNKVLKASELFKVFDNGFDVEYDCRCSEVTKDNGEGLSRIQYMYNDCLLLIKDIISSINKKISESNGGQSETNDSNQNE